MTPQLQVGASRVLLRPPLKIAMAGYGRRTGRAEGVHDELAAQAIVLSDGTNKAAVVSVDVLALGIRICDAIGAEVEAETGIPAAAVMICATHTHSGPQFNFFATPAHDSKPTASSDRNLDWERSLPEKIVQAIIEAHAKLRPAALSVIAGEFKLGTNRRLMRADGTIQLAPNYAGISDHELSALGFYEPTPERDPVAIILNYPCHGVVLCEDNLRYSGDWPGAAVSAAEQMANERGPKTPAIALFTQGAAGNIDPNRRGSFEIAEQVGGGAAMTAITALDDAGMEDELPIICRRVPLRMKLRDLGSILAVARANLHQTDAALRSHNNRGGYHQKRLIDQHQLSMSELGALEALDQANRRDKRIDAATGELITHMTILAIGDIALVGVPGELFVELGLAIKANSNFRRTIVVGYCNDLVGYIPTREAYEQGGYEVTTSRVAKGSGEMLVQTALTQLDEMLGIIDRLDRQRLREASTNN